MVRIHSRIELRVACMFAVAALVSGTQSNCFTTVMAETPATKEAEAPKETRAAADFTSTHKQAQIIKPLVDGEPVQLNTFCLDRDGNILACVGGSSVRVVVNKDGSQQTKSVQTPQQVQVISPSGNLIRSTELSFMPTAINQAPNGLIFVAGSGKVSVIDADGKLVTTADSPHIGNVEELKQRVAEDTKKQAEKSQQLMQDQLKRVEERIAAITSKPEADRTELETKRLATFEQQKTLYENQLKSVQQTATRPVNVEALISRKMGITALAVTSRDVFLCCNAVEGTGYEVWRTNHELSDPVKVVSDLRGCCGQCDIQATDEHLVLAENTRFQVGVLDRDGKRLTAFGKGDRKAVDGFGSCCNPMNVRCCSNGDILTAESSIGTIKRFSKSGELLGVVGKAKIGGGCKHVALALDEKRDRYYMMNVDKDHICVMVPLSEAPEMTPEEALADAARKGLGRKLVGEWSLDGNRPADAPEPPSISSSEVSDKATETQPDAARQPATVSKPATTAKPATAFTAVPATRLVVPVNRVQSDPYTSTYINFVEDGTLLTVGGLAGADGWEAVRQEGDTLYATQIRGGIQYYEYIVEFVGDAEATISLMYNDRALGSNRYKRVKSNAGETK